MMMMMKRMLLLKLLDRKVLNLKSAKFKWYIYGCSLSYWLDVQINGFDYTLIKFLENSNFCMHRQNNILCIVWFYAF